MREKNMRYGQFLRSKRVSDGRELTLKDVAEELGVSVSFVSDVEQGRRKPYDEAKTQKLIEFLKFSEDDVALMYAYAAKSGLRRGKIAELMSNETWMNAKKAVELGFADEVLFEAEGPEQEGGSEEAAAPPDAEMYSNRMMDRAILNRLGVTDAAEPKAREEPVIGMDGRTKDGAVPYGILMDQLDLLR